MNSSEPLQPLTSYEEKLTAYLDGALPPEDAAAFAQQHPEVVEMRASHLTLSGALRRHSSSPPLGNGEFFNHQILRQIEPRPEPRRQRAALPFWRLIFAGACGILAAVAIFQNLPPTAPLSPTASAPAKAPKYFAQVTHVEPGDNLLTAKLVNAEGLAVVWVEGMDNLSPDYVLQ